MESFDPETVTADRLAELFPQLGLFAAEDIVEWRSKNGFPDEATLTGKLGIGADQAQLITSALTGAAGSPPSDAAEDTSFGGEAPTPIQPREAAIAMTAEVPPGSEHPADLADVNDVESAPVDEPHPAPPPARVVPPPLPTAVVEESRPSPPALPIVREPERMVVSAVSESSLPAFRASAAPERSQRPSAIVPKASPGPARMKRSTVAAITVAVLSNVALVGAVVHLAVDNRATRAPVAALKEKVNGLQNRNVDDRRSIEETREELTHARERLDEHERVLAATVDAVEANARRQLAADREARERQARSERDVAALASRIARAEKRVEQVYSLTEAMKTVDEVLGKPEDTRHPQDPPRH